MAEMANNSTAEVPRFLVPDPLPRHDMAFHEWLAENHSFSHRERNPALCECLLQWIDKAKNIPEFKRQINHINPKYCDQPNVHLALIHLNLFKPAHQLQQLDPDVLRNDVKRLWNILINLFNSHAEDSNPSLYADGLELFHGALKHFAVDQINTKASVFDYSPVFTAVRFKDTRILQSFVELGCNIEIRENGLTPLLDAVSRSNPSAVKYLVQSGACVDAIVKNDDVPEGTHRIGIQVVRSIWLHQSLPELPAPKGMNCRELATAIHKHFIQYMFCENELFYKNIEILNFFGLEVNRAVVTECPVCLAEQVHDPFALACAHTVCRKCACAIQTARDYAITCPLCRTVTSCAGAPVVARLIVKSVGGGDKFIEVIPAETTVGDIVRKILLLGNHMYPLVKHDNVTLELGDTRPMLSAGFGHLSVFLLWNRMPHSVTAAEREEWERISAALKRGAR